MDPRILGAAVVLVLVSAIALFQFAWRGGSPFTSDQSVVILMAQDIRHGRAFPIFYEGVAYAGTLEPLLLAFSFLFLPETLLTFRLVMGLLTVATVLTVWRIGATAFGEKAGFAGGLLLAAGPAFFVFRGLQSDGAYDATLLLGAIAVLLALLADERASGGRPAGPFVLAMLATAGAAWWVMPLSVVFLVPAALLLLARPVRSQLRPRLVLAAAMLFVAGGLPWWLFNVPRGFPSLFVPELGRAAPADAFAKVPDLFEQGLTEILGLRAPWSDRLFPGGAAIAIVIFCTLVVVAGFTSVTDPLPHRRRAATALGSLLIASPVAALAISRTDFTEARYLLPLYVAVAPLAGWALVRYLRPVAAIVAGAALLAIHVFGHATSLTSWNLQLESANDMGDALATLEKAGVRALYTPYWTAYKATFLSGGKIVGTPLGAGGVMRRDADHARVDRDPHPAFLLWGDEADRLAAFAPAAKMRRVSNGTLFWDVPQYAVGLARRCNCVPNAVTGCVAWGAISGPGEIVEGGRARYEVTVANAGAVRWPEGLHLSYHLQRPDGASVFFDGTRTDLPALSSADPAERMPVDVLGNVAVGEYRIAFDAVEEGVAWFSERGCATPLRPVRVLSRDGGHAPPGSRH